MSTNANINGVNNANSWRLYDVQKAYNAAYAQGYQIGNYSGHPFQLGTVAGATVASNQNGDYVLTNGLGEVRLMNLHRPSYQTQEYFDQTSNSIFTFSTTSQKAVSPTQLSSNMSAQDIKNMFN